MTSKLGLHWIRVHPDQHDLAHIEKMQYKSVKLFEWHWNNRDACRDLMTVLPGDAYILARDHPMSEQKQDMWNDPVGTGTRHANEWAIKVATGNVHTPHDRTFFLGINEPDATSGDRNAIDVYTAAFLDRLRVHGLRGGAFNFSTGHPRTVDGTGATQADYSVFERSHQAIVAGHHIGVLHIYGTANVPCAPGHYDRLKACTWQDVEWIVGECGADEHVIGGGNHDGYLRTLGASEAYCRWLDDFIMGVNDPRIHSYQVFSYDFSHPWDSFDIRPIRPHLEAYRWQHVNVASTPQHDLHLPSISTPPQADTPVPVGEAPPAAVAYVQAPAGANIRQTPDVRPGNIITAVAYGEPVMVAAYQKAGNGTRWAQVTYQGASGWTVADLLGETPPAPAPAPTQPEPTPQPTGNDWPRIYAFIKRWEGGWADHPNDPGGATNKGITIGTFIRWRESRGLPTPTKDDLRHITDAEAEQIFYEWYYKASGADKLPWPLNLAQADTAVNAGTGRAAEMLAKSGGDFLAYMGHLIDWYTRIENFEHFGRAWIRRRAEILLEASKS